MPAHLFGRELADAKTATTVRVWDGRPQLTGGALLESGPFHAGLSVLECASLDLAMPAAGTGRDGNGDLTDASPFLLTGWIGALPAPVDDRPLIDAIAAWRQELDRRGGLYLASVLGGVETAVTLRRAPQAVTLGEGPFITVGARTATIEVIAAHDQHEAIELAGSHPLARGHAIEVRAFVV